MKITFANMLTDLCDRLPGADAAEVTAAVGGDSRIGAKYLRGAVAYGGPCFPRDNKAFSVLARSVGADPLLAEATDVLNTRQTDRLDRYVAGALGGRPHQRVCILGMSYKPGTPVIDESAGVALAQRLASQGHVVVVYDP